MEKIRRAIRSIIGYDSAVYKLGAAILDFLSISSKDGIKVWYTLDQLKNKLRNGEPAHSITLKKLKHPILIRPGTEDVGTIITNVVREEYGHFVAAKEPLWMIDAGAYIGDTTAYFLSRFPNLKVIVLEPNPESYELAKRNLQAYGDRVILLQKGLFSNEQIQYLSGFSTDASITDSGVEIECTTISSLLEFYSIPFVDILKIDIEGAEEAIFSSKPEAWLHRIGLLIIEIHGSRIESLISHVLSENGFSMERYRSLWYCWQGKK
jgi:FkbM family methyltransferase